MCGELAGRGRRGRRDSRFIPACAGNSPGRSAGCGGVAVHPRVCGELPVRLRQPHQLRRFIPACAGNSFSQGKAGTVINGSSPRVRGTPGEDGVGIEWIRFIPACAGNSPKVVVDDAIVYGSSPRVRGTRRRSTGRSSALRFIPACAGNSAAPWWRCPGTPVHPRVCGELAPKSPGHAAGCGSSPRVRGTPSTALVRRKTKRFIPACAGNSCRTPRKTETLPVHPRVCGELVGYRYGL